MTSQPTSGPGSGLIASKQTAITSAQIKALFTTPVVVSPTPRADQVVAPLQWFAVATDSDTFYDNPMSGALAMAYGAGGQSTDMAALLAALTAGAASFLVGRGGDIGAITLAGVPGTALVLAMDAGNLTDGDFGITFSLFYALIPAS